jgi:histidyl-tRNA synthetase
VDQAVPALKAEHRGNLIVSGGGELAHTLTRLGLVDEFWFWVSPNLWPTGPRIFDGVGPVRLELVAAMDLSDYVRFDVTIVRGLAYYTGIVFEIFDRKGEFRAICGGGRYDHLIGRFGDECPSTGFAIDIEKLQMALERQGALRPPMHVDFLIMDFKPDKRDALRIAKELRQRGYRVARDIIRRDLAGSLAYAQRMGIARGIILGTNGLGAHEALLKDLEAGWERVVSVSELVPVIVSLDDRPST